ncbi:hypothetical protein BJ878DRAFT_480619 [Calycina marina]|uniref:Uncharacterized protein n=1 Tax=Calycina marina TaxID=1763456 RepID=A0A9P7Z263_9HELO|nr:hypothetical protein BJ878DRAFT_480619 [Calycina marina]
MSSHHQRESDEPPELAARQLHPNPPRYGISMCCCSRPAENNEPTSSRNELSTTANTQELKGGTKDEQGMTEFKKQENSPYANISRKPLAELSGTSQARILNVVEGDSASYTEMEGRNLPISVPTHTHGSVSEVGDAASTSFSATENKEARLATLQQRLEKVRQDKERMHKLQELEMIEELKAELSDWLIVRRQQTTAPPMYNCYMRRSKVLLRKRRLVAQETVRQGSHSTQVNTDLTVDDVQISRQKGVSLSEMRHVFQEHIR